MRCLMCDCELGYGSLRDILFGDDPLCLDCRRQWQKRKICFDFEGHRLRSSYVYNEAFSRCLIQYKELCDEALKDVFLYENLRWFQRTYRGYQIAILPSSLSKQAKRGFSHLEKMFACTGMEIIDPFLKTDEGDQKKKTVRQRAEIENRIFLKPDAELKKKIVLCDDTITTGSTMKGALRALGEENVHVEIYTVSVNRRWIHSSPVMRFTGRQKALFPL